MDVHVGDAVVFVDPLGHPRVALVTAVWGKEIYPGPDGTGPSVNLIIVSDDEMKTDPYGRQIERHTSIVHVSRQPAPGNFWRGSTVAMDVGELYTKTAEGENAPEGVTAKP